MNLHRTRPLALLLGLALIAGACSDDDTDNDAGTEPPTTTVVANPPTDDGGADGDDGASPESGGSPAFLSAYLGLVDLPATGIPLLEGVSGCDQEELDEGMPVVLSHPVDADTLDPADFVVTTASGDVAKPTCATLEPATEDGELQTVLLTGPLGTADDRPVRVSIQGQLSATDGTDLTGLETDEVDAFEDGPEIVMARLDPAGQMCGSLGSTHEIQTTWQGGVTGPRNSEPGAGELEGFMLVDAGGDAHALLGFDDLGDGDNYVVVCVPSGVEPVTLDVRAETLYDPTNNPNPATSAEVSMRLQSQ